MRLFEVGNVFREGMAETQRIAGVACGRAFAEQWGESNRAVDFHDVKGDVESMLALTNVSGDARPAFNAAPAATNCESGSAITPTAFTSPAAFRCASGSNAI